MSTIYKSEAGERLLRETYEKTLEHWPVPSEHLRVPTPEGETFVVASGRESAPPLVLLHGSGSNSMEWMPRIATLAEHFRVYSVDIIGEPGLSAPSRPPLESDRYAVWLDAVLDHLGVDRTRILAISLGGWVALDYASRRPERVERMALSCPVGVGRQKWGFLLRVGVLNLFGEWGKRRSMALILGSEYSTMKPEHVTAIGERQHLVAKHYRYRTTLPVLGDDALRRLAMPLHVLAGARDVMLDTATTKRRLDALVPHATVRLLPGVGHLIVGHEDEQLEFLTSGGVPESPRSNGA
ncbi:pimeloyl-ACP methyl ester carboxylesterase [Herbihabitans rhizosphaerae]|uniref:Pimeloyl-ACP methyl ester carboxylesterase n=1 Tax=Herbihabitans rhizosphaerae TaxID=1872711 RepID=A0A4Q7KBX6_9PSEU|nr:alpha/beta hydrolase [Herbihabitans rhizosphaerae]RZS29762.1 pimeloyl-ACP methyl ester carboxylesterase [Herbihabitans rhizosphaerae]